MFRIQTPRTWQPWQGPSHNLAFYGRVAFEALRVARWLGFALMLWGCNAEEEQVPPQSSPMDMAAPLLPDASQPVEDMAPDLGSCHAQSCPDGSIVHVPDHLWITPGSGFTYAPQLLDENGEVVADARFKYSVDRPEVAVIDQEGELSTMSGGIIYITVRLGELEHITKAWVSHVTPGINAPAQRGGKVGETVELYMNRGIDFETDEYIYLEAEYESMDESVATVERDTGLVTMVGEGETTVTGTAKYQGETMSCKIIVTNE